LPRPTEQTQSSRKSSAVQFIPGRALNAIDRVKDQAEIVTLGVITFGGDIRGDGHANQ
jgi:hypothetical protein